MNYYNKNVLTSYWMVYVEHSVSHSPSTKKCHCVKFTVTHAVLVLA